MKHEEIVELLGRKHLDFELTTFNPLLIIKLTNKNSLSTNST